MRKARHGLGTGTARLASLSSWHVVTPTGLVQSAGTQYGKHFKVVRGADKYFAYVEMSS